MASASAISDASKDSTTITDMTTTTNTSQVDTMKVDELKAALKSRKLKTCGNKAKLVERLKAAMILDSASDDNDDDDENHDDGDRTVLRRKDDVDNEDTRSAIKSCRKNEYVPTFKDVEESMEAFSGDSNTDVTRWITDFEETAELCEWNDVQCVIYAKRLLRGSAKIFVSYEKCAKTWRQLKSALKTEFGHKVNSNKVHKDLCRRKKRTDESYHQYIYEMVGIASQASIELSAIIQYIIDGVNDDEMNKAILYGSTNIRELKAKFDIYETMKTNARTKQRHVDTSRKATSPISTTVIRCFNCGEKNHMSSDCPLKSKGVKCFRCNEHGHIASKCTNNKNFRKNDCNAVRTGQKKHEKEVDIQGHKFVALIDSGSDISLLRSDHYFKIGAPTLEKRVIQFRGVGCDDNISLGQTRVEVNIDGILYEIIFHVVPDNLIQQGIIIGSDFLHTVDVRLRQGKVTICKIQNADIPEIFKIDACVDNALDFSNIKDENLKTELEAAVKDYKPNKTRETGIKMRIILKDEIPIYQRPRRLSPREMHEVDTQIQEWLSKGIIKVSHSEYASPIVLVKKKDGTTRICIDYRKLNEKVVKDRFPLPLIEDQIDRLQGAKVYSTIDLQNGFFHVPIENESTKYTAFVVPNGQFEFLRMPFGLCNAPSVFQRFINAIFREDIAKGIALTYMDDLIIPAIDSKTALDNLKVVLHTASEHGLEVNWKKCRFLQTKIQYLGHVIENGNVSPSEDKTIAVKKFPKPNDVKSVQSFLGLTGYFRKFVPQYSVVARPLTNLLKAAVKFKFEEEEERAFNQLKTILTSRPVLKLYRINAETELHTDASKFGYAAILLQKDNVDQLFHPVYYASGKTTPPEEKYTSYELEVLAIVKSLRKFRVYLLGIRFKIVTDCQAFTLTMNKRDLCTRVARWALLLTEFDYVIEHRPGRNMTHVDALSRNPIPTVMFTETDNEGATARFRQSQINDDELKQILNNEEKQRIGGYAIKNGLVYKEISEELMLVVPKAMQSEIIRHAHKQGHFAAEKTEKIIKRDYWFRRMRQNIEKVIRNCVECILAERKHGKQEGFLHTIDKGTKPLDTYHIDHIGPLPSTRKNYKHIFIVVDAFTKFVWLYPTKSTSTSEVLDRLKKQATTFGNPRRIISDQGTAFTSHEFKDYCKDEGIYHGTIATGLPRGNGQVERMNRILIPVLAKLSAQNPDQWFKHIDNTQRYLNNSPTRSTGTSPFYLLIGTHMRLKDDSRLKELLEEEEAALFEERRDLVRNIARERIRKIQEENKKTYNKRRKQSYCYKQDDLVAIKRTQFGPGLKLHSKFYGPYRVSKVLRNDRYLVEKIGEHEGPQKTSTSTDHMKLWIVNDSDCGDSVSEDDESDSSK